MHESLVNFPIFLTALLILMVAAKVGAEIAERLGQPSVLGEILAGVLVGASGFGLIVHGFSDGQAIYHLLNLNGASGQATYEALDALAEIGVIVLMFEIGLHCDLYALRNVGKSALWVGCAGVVLPFIGGYCVSHYLLGLATFPAIFVGAALTATSVGITARVFHDLRLLHSAESQVVLGAAVTDDVIGLVILAIVTALGETAVGAAQPNLLLEGAKVSIIAIGFLVGAVAVGVKCVPLVDKLFEGAKSRGGLTVIALAFCIVMALLSRAAGLAPIIGAFAGGLVLSHCHKRQEIQDTIKPLADLFIPIFFAMMGTVVNLHAVAEGGVLVIAFALLSVAVVGKVLGSMTVPDKRLHKLTIGLAMIPRGEVDLIFARQGIQHGWLKPSYYDAMVLMVLATTLMTPPLLRLATLKLKAQRGELEDAKAGLAEAKARRSDLGREDWEVFDADTMLQTPNVPPSTED